MKNCNFFNINLDHFEAENNHQISSKMVHNQSNTLLNRILRESRLRRISRLLSGKPSNLFSLSTMLQSEALVNMMEIGIHSVPLQLVIGSESRCYDFDDHFVPKSEKDYQRWLRISDLYISEATIPAVDLIQVDKFFFVRDGHHRVSVAKALRKKFIDANIKVMQVKDKAIRDFKCCAESLDLEPIEQFI